MSIVEAGTIARTPDGKAVTGILLAATKEEIAALPFNPYGAEVELVKAEPKKTVQKKGERK